MFFHPIFTIQGWLYVILTAAAIEPVVIEEVHFSLIKNRESSHRRFKLRGRATFL